MWYRPALLPQLLGEDGNEITMTQCKIDGCEGKVVGWGWCRAHYKRWRRHGDPLAGQKRGAKKFYAAALSFDGDDCLFWPFARNENGYAVMKPEPGLSALVSRRICAAVHGPAPTAQHEAAHSCGNGHIGCISPKHLRWATSAENKADMVGHGTSTRGERNHHVKLTEKDVLAIYAAQEPKPEVAERFGVSLPTIYDIQSGRSWGWLTSAATEARR